MIRRIRACPTLEGEITLPGDKSISHRALIFNGIAVGKAMVGNLSPGSDLIATIDCLRALGVRIDEGKSSEERVVFGVSERGLSEPEDVLNAGNSATTMRLLTGLLAAQSFLSVITGDGSLRSRPMGRIIAPLRLMGAEIRGRGHDSLAPLAIRGQPLHGITYSLPVPSAQVKSAVLIAALFARGDTTVEQSIPSRDHTERFLKAMGASVEVDGCQIAVTPLSVPLTSVDLRVPGDISSAAYWLVAGAIHPNARLKLTGVGINPTRAGIIDALLEMGANLKIENQRMEGEEPLADLVIESSELVGIDVGGDMIPRLIDEIPVFAVAASVAKGDSVIRGAGELRVKETDRIVTTAKELSKLGAGVEELPDGMLIHGERRLQGAECSSLGDHRLAMTLGVAALVAEGQTMIHDAEAVDISYPGFWWDLEALCHS
jgi:3-phosphoshikimate 1-carboxyvinyltransferase